MKKKLIFFQLLKKKNFCIFLLTGFGQQMPSYDRRLKNKADEINKYE